MYLMIKLRNLVLFKNFEKSFFVNKPYKTPHDCNDQTWILLDMKYDNLVI